MGDDSESWQDEDIDFWVSEESEEMLVQHGVSSSCRVEEGGVEITVRE